ncbi:MAG TPA: hypothetical protein VHY58_23715 [Streptosporangiaceae bacterium]|jgi:hypothetical protein|nr:hypothetical protein [Streptosporangiaceae bacterium]
MTSFVLLRLRCCGEPDGDRARVRAAAPGASGVYYVDDAINTLNLLH